MRLHARVLVGVLSVALSWIPLYAQSVCGNGAREGGEQCDDGNTQNADGCSAQCLFEQNQRMNQLKMQFATLPTLCTGNALGGAFASQGQTQLQSSIDSSVADGTTSILLSMLGLDDLSGTSDAAVQVGVVNATPRAAAPGLTYNGTSDLDWWYMPDATDVDASRLPISRLNGSIAAQVLTAGPGSVILAMPLAGSSARLYITSGHLRAQNGASSAPQASGNGYPPGHVPNENLDSTLQSYATSGPSTSGELCGNVRAASLAAIPIPLSLTTGPTACTSAAGSHVYTSANTWLDVIVGGCKVTVTFIAVTVVVPTQPDRTDTDAPPAGNGPPYILSLGAGNHVTSCTANGVAAPLADCLNAAAYSSFFKFSSDRVIEKPSCPTNSLAASNDGPVCVGGTVHLTATGAVADYQWTGPNGFSSALQNPSISGVTKNNAGDYFVTVNASGCTATATTTVTVNDVVTPTIAAPATAYAGQPGLTASVAAHAGSTYAWTITNGTITAGQGTDQITFTAGASGSTNLGVTETASTGCTSAQAAATVTIVFGPPQNVVATATTPTSVAITWTPTVNAVSYEVARQDLVGVFGPIASPPYNDTTASADTAYLYTVRAVDGSATRSAFSAPDLATTVIFTDDPLAPGTTIVKMTHINELRTAVNAVRALTPLGAFSFTDPTLTTDTPIKAVHVSELRTALDQARSNLALAVLTYTDPTLTPGTTLVKAPHVQELREGVK